MNHDDPHAGMDALDASSDAQRPDDASAASSPPARQKYTAPQHLASGLVAQARDIDTSRPSAARLYDYYLGGNHNYPVDRQFATEVMALCPWLPAAARYNRAFLRHAVQYMIREGGVRQFLDIGSGVPTVSNVHEVAHEIDPTIRVVYVDNDNEAIATAQRMLAAVPTATSIYGDAQLPETILQAPQTRELIDFTQPVGLLMLALLHFIPDSKDPKGLTRQYLDVLPTGSYFAASHATEENMAPENQEEMRALDRRYGDTANPSTLRTKAQFETFFHGWKFVPPGITYAADWHAPERPSPADPARLGVWAGVAFKP